jgi:hypothetical protein
VTTHTSVIYISNDGMKHDNKLDAIRRDATYALEELIGADLDNVANFIVSNSKAILEIIGKLNSELAVIKEGATLYSTCDGDILYSTCDGDIAP